MKTSSEIVVDLPVERIDLPGWLKILSDRDYQTCSPDHRAAGIFYEDGVFGSVNVESVGGHLLVHHYLSENAVPAKITMRSRDNAALRCRPCAPMMKAGVAEAAAPKIED